MAGKFTWKGDEVKAKVRQASIRGINVVLGNCVITAKQLVHVQYAILQGSIHNKPAAAKGNGAHGEWGSWDVNYAFWQEVLPSSRGGKPYLRPSADQHYRTLGSEIQRAM